MPHPLIPQILETAIPIAESLGLEVVEVVFHTHQTPPILRIDIRNRQTHTGLQDCEQMSRALESELDRLDLIPGAYVLEVSSPGTGRQLTSDREFIAFKGFAVVVETQSEGEKQTWRGHLQGRDETQLLLNQKGKLLSLPWAQVLQIRLDDRHP